MAFFGNKRKEDRRQGNRRGGQEILVGDVIQDKMGHISTVQNTATLIECAKVLTFMKVGLLVVVDENSKFVGTIAEKAIIQALANHEADAIELTVADILSHEVLACARETELNDVLDMMKQNAVRHVPVMDQGKVTGVVSISDILRHYL